MAVIDTAKRASMALSLNAGTDISTGKTVKKSLTISGLRLGADNDKLVAVADLISPCLEYPVIEITKTEVVTLEKE